MSAVWLTIEQAAKRVDRSPSTIRRWGRDGKLRIFPNGKVIEGHVLAVDRRMRERVGRPPGTRVPLMFEGREVGHITIRPDGEISGRIEA